MTGREVARLLGRASHGGVQKVLRRLVEHGVVDQSEAGSALLYSLNREHLAAPAVRVLADMRRELLVRLREAIGRWRIQPVHASLFGSAARADGDTRSDIDVFLVRPIGVEEDNAVWREQVDSLCAQIGRWTGNRTGISEVSAAGLDVLLGADPPILATLRGEAIALAGVALPSLVPDAR